MRRLALPALALLLVASALLSALTLPVHAQVADPVIGAQGVLDARLRAVAARDEPAFMATVDPEAPESFRSAQKRLFEGLVSVPFADASMRVVLEDSGDLADGLDVADKHGADRALLPETRFSYRIAEYDDRPAIDVLWLTYVSRNGRWFVASDSDAEIIGLDTNRQMWDFGSLVVQRTPHFAVLTRADQQVRGAALGAIAEEAMTIFASRWPRPWSQRIPLVIPSSPQQTAQILGTPIDVANFSAFVVYTPVRDKGYATTAPRIYAQEQNLAVVSRSRQVADLVHELAHAASSTLSGPFTTPWLHEGLAEYVRLDRPLDVRPPDGRRDRFPTTADFGADAASVRLAYGESTSIMSMIGRVRGRDAPLEMFVAVGERRVVAGSAAYNVDQAARATTGLGLSELQARWLAGQ